MGTRTNTRSADKRRDHVWWRWTEVGRGLEPWQESREAGRARSNEGDVPAACTPLEPQKPVFMTGLSGGNSSEIENEVELPQPWHCHPPGEASLTVSPQPWGHTCRGFLRNEGILESRAGTVSLPQMIQRTLGGPLSPSLHQGESQIQTAGTFQSAQLRLPPVPRGPASGRSFLTSEHGCRCQDTLHTPNGPRPKVHKAREAKPTLDSGLLWATGQCPLPPAPAQPSWGSAPSPADPGTSEHPPDGPGRSWHPGAWREAGDLPVPRAHPQKPVGTWDTWPLTPEHLRGRLVREPGPKRSQHLVWGQAEAPGGCGPCLRGALCGPGQALALSEP